MSTIHVGTADLRQALISVAPHASPVPEDSVLHRVRLTVGDDLLVSATNRFSAGHAIVSIEGHDGEVTTVDLSPQNVKEILALFRGKRGTDDEMGDSVRITVSDDHFTITDTSGLFEGKSLALPRYPDADNYPDIGKLIRITLARPPAGAERLLADGKRVAMFRAAAAAYGEALWIQPTGKTSTLVISCGESFIGLLMPMRPSEDQQAQLEAWREGWLRRLPELDGVEVAMT